TILIFHVKFVDTAEVPWVNFRQSARGGNRCRIRRGNCNLLVTWPFGRGSSRHGAALVPVGRISVNFSAKRQRHNLTGGEYQSIDTPPKQLAGVQESKRSRSCSRSGSSTRALKRHHGKDEPRPIRQHPRIGKTNCPHCLMPYKHRHSVALTLCILVVFGLILHIVPIMITTDRNPGTIGAVFATRIFFSNPSFYLPKLDDRAGGP